MLGAIIMAFIGAVILLVIVKVIKGIALALQPSRAGTQAPR